MTIEVQSARNRGNSSSPSVTFGAGVTSGHAAILTIIFMADDGVAIDGLTPSASGLGGTWVNVKDSQLVATNGPRIITFLAKSLTSGTTITVSLGDVCQYVIIAAELPAISQSLTQPGDTDLASGTVPQAGGTASGGATTTRGRDYLWAALAAYTAWSASPAMTVDLDPDGLYDKVRQYTRAFSFSEFSWVELLMSVGIREAAAAGTYGLSWAIDGDMGGSGGPWHVHGVSLQLIGPVGELAGTIYGASEAFAMLTAVHSESVPTSPIALPERWMVRRPGDTGWTDLSSWAYLVTRIGGADAHPPLRGQDAPYTSRPGRQSLAKLHDGRTITLLIHVLPTDEDGELAEPSERQQARVNLDALNQILAMRAPLEVMRVMPDGTGRVAAAEVASVAPVEDELTGVIFGLSVDLFLADPWFYGLVDVDERTISAATTSFTITNPGDVDADFLIIEMLGALTNPRLHNLRTGHVLEYTGALTSSQRLVYNVRQATARLNGASALGSVTRYAPAGHPEFFALAPGDNPLELTVSANGGDLVITTRPPYV